MASRLLLGLLRPRLGVRQGRREALVLVEEVRPQPHHQSPQRGLATTGGGERRKAGPGPTSRPGRRKFQPLPPVPPSTTPGDDDEAVVVFQEEDTEDLATFLQEYDALEQAEADATAGQGGQPDAPLVVEEYKMEEGEDGDLRMVLHSARSPAAGDDSVQALLHKAKQAGTMTEEDWFEFLRRSGMQRSMASSPRAAMAGDHAETTPPPLRRGRQTRKGPPKFVDRIAVAVSGGKGGKGCISFEAVGNAKGGAAKRPSGGHGGQGGDVIFVADPRVQSLEMDRHHFHGKDGETGDSNNKRGARGRHTVVRVPCGTVVKEVVRNEEGRYDRVEVFDLDAPMSHYVAAAGGKPGLGNSVQAGRARKSSSASGNFRAPGHQGQQRYYELELKTIADVGLVGYPNAGKSTLLGGLSRAQPKVASYPFTTLHPTVGRVEFTDAASLTVADLPGLIEGAHANKGLGHEFLRHIERTKVLLYVLDGVGSAEGLVNEAPVEVLRKLKNELERYCPGLSRRPSLVWLNKADLNAEWVQEAKAAVEAVLKEEEGEEGHDGVEAGKHGVHNRHALPPIVLWGSARTGDRLGDLAHELRRILQQENNTEGTRSGSGGGQGGGGGGPRGPGTDDDSPAEAHGMQLAHAVARALDAAQAHNHDVAESMRCATEASLRSRRSAAALEVSRRHSYWLAQAMAMALAHKQTTLATV